MMRGGLVLALLALGACLRDATVECADGQRCPSGFVCAPGGGCALDSAADACVGLDDGARCDVPEVGEGRCAAGLCVFAVCGDGVREGEELCDDGNRVDGDGCAAFCNSLEECGNDVLDSGEECDDGNVTGGDGCQPGCLAPRCGDGFLDEAEACDDGNRDDGDGCAAFCNSLEQCGNGVRDLGEECDDGNLTDHDDCQGNCQTQRCGDGVLDPLDGEVCDDGDNLPADGCAAACDSDETCGNGAVDYVVGEECDDGNVVDHDGCQGRCVVQRCGDGVLDPLDGEVCDDGNNAAGDGCDPTCASQELCGDGVVGEGEACDDGGLRSHDGCDSRCQLDAAAWTRAVVTPSLELSAQHAVVDEATGQLLHHGAGTTWAWDGVAWQILASGGPALPSYALTYDTNRNQVLLIGRGASLEVWRWTGTGWTPAPSSGASPALSVLAFDAARDVVVMVAEGEVSTWSPTDGTWTSLPPPLFDFAYGATIAFDRARAEVVVVQGGAFDTDWGGPPDRRPITWRFDGTIWTPVDDFPAEARSGMALAYDDRRGAVVAVGGGIYERTDSGMFLRSASTLLYTWDGTTWSEAGQVPWPVRAAPFAGYAALRDELLVFSGMTFCGSWSCPSFDDVWHEGAAAWTSRVPPARTGAAMAFDPSSDELVVFGGLSRSGLVLAETWRYDGTWRRQVTNTSPPGRASDLRMVHDPVREALILYDGNNQQTWRLDDDWVGLPVTAPAVGGARAMAYDPIGQRLVLVTGSQTWTLASTGTAWSLLGAGPSGTAGSLAFDAAQGLMTYTNQTTGQVSDLIGASWVATVSPGAGYRVAAAPSLGALHFVGTPSVPAWQRRGGAWSPLLAPPLAPASVLTAAPRDGRIAAFAVGPAAFELMTHRLGSLLASEDCSSADLDGDGAIECADPDCWWACAPTCPPDTSCALP